MTFVAPVLLLLLWLVPLFVAGCLWLHRRGRAKAAAISVAASRSQSRDTRFFMQLACVAAGLSLMIVASARPCWGEREEIVFSKGRNVVIAVDVSRSMLAEDVRPNRLERARADLRDLIADLRGDRAGLLAFRGGAQLLCPLTTDTSFLRHVLEGMSIHSAPRGETDIGGAIDKALETLETFAGDHNAIVLISDGEDLGGKAVAAAKTAGSRGIPIFTVGIGDARGATIPMHDGRPQRFRDEEVVTKLDNQTLLDVATASGGAYVPLQTAGTGRMTLGTLYQRHLRHVASQDLLERAERRKVERYQWFLVPGILCLMAMAWLSRGRNRRRRAGATSGVKAGVSAAVGGAAVLVLCAVAAGAPMRGLAQNIDIDTPASPATDVEAREEREARLSGADRARQAQDAFRKGSYAEAADAYLEASRDPALSSRLAGDFLFNAALAQLRAGASTNAASTFRDALRRNDKLAAANEGLGVALFEAATSAPEGVSAGQGGDSATGESEPAAVEREVSAADRATWLAEASEAFQAALRQSPDSVVGRRNLAAAAAPLPQLRDQAHRDKVMEKYGETPPEQLLADLLKRQRQAYAQGAAALTNRTPAQITEIEAAAKRQREAADLWMPLAPQLMQAFGGAVTNQQEMAQIKQQLMSAAPRMLAAASALDDLDPAGLQSIAQSERDASQFLAMVAPPPPLLEEALLAQTNAVANIVSDGSLRAPLAEQAAAQLWTGLFAQRFPQWADQIMQSGGASGADVAAGGDESAGGEPPALTPEDRAEIEALAKETLDLQAKILGGVSDPGIPLLPPETAELRARALANLQRIRELMPRQSQQQQQEQQQEEQNQQDEQEQSPEQNQEEKPDEQEQEEKPEPDKQDVPEDMQALMDRVLQREKEHEEEKRERLNKLPPLLNERDW